MNTDELQIIIDSLSGQIARQSVEIARRDAQIAMLSEMIRNPPQDKTEPQTDPEPETDTPEA